MLRPLEKLICMEVLAFKDQVKSPAEFEEEVDGAEFSPDELELPKKLMEATTNEEFDIGQFENVYHDKLQQLIEAKIEGKEIVAMPEEQPEQVINLMDALKASVAQAQDASQAKKVAKSSTKRKSAAGKKKTG